MKNFARPATTFVTVVLALTALVTSSAAMSNVAARHMLARSPSSLLDATAGHHRMLAIGSASEIGQQEAARRKMLF